MSSDLFDFNRGVPENHDEVVAFLSDHFLVEETMNVALRLTKEEFVPFVEEVVVNCLSSGYTVLARDKDSGQIAGLVLNTVWRRADGAHASQATKRPLRPTASQAIEVFLSTFAALFWHLAPPNVDAVLHRHHTCPSLPEVRRFREILSVGARWQRRGLASRLLDEGYSISELRERGIGGFASKTSSLANQCLMTKKGYTELMSIPFASVIDAEGKPLVVPEDGTARNVLFFKIVE